MAPEHASRGLARGAVRIVSYDPAWPRLFEEERDRLAARLGLDPTAFAHIGSTAVPGLSAKPILDLAVAVDDFGVLPGWTSRLAADGYSYRGDPEGRGDHLLAKGPEERRTVYLHVVRRDGPRWHAYLRFRDRLRGDAALREAYDRLKRALAAEFPVDRAAYAERKAPFIARLLAE